MKTQKKETSLEAHGMPKNEGANGKGDEQRTAEFMQRLLDAGLIRGIKAPVADYAPYRDDKPLEVKGQPLSEVIIEDRR